MMRIVSIVVLVAVISLQSVQAQWVTNYRYGVKYNQNEGSVGPKLNIGQYDLIPGTFSYRLSTDGGTTGYYDRTGWDSDPYTQGYLLRTNTTPDQFKQNYRLLFPNNYDPNLAEGYPIIVMMHGAGERGNCWGNNCYFSNSSWDPETNSPAVAGPTTNLNLLNNDHNLVHGGLPHLQAVNRAGSKLLGDPTLADNAYPGFVLFPQNTNGWSGTSIKETIRIIHKVLDENNIDRNKVVVHGLSNGAQHVVTLVKYDPSMFAGVLLMSPSSANTKVRDSEELAHIPFWVFQGGKDNNPSVSETNSLVRWFQEMGGTIELNIYDNLGHGTWNTAYAEDNFFPWIKEKDKSDVHVYFGDSTICASNGNGAKLGVSHGFQAYQWERDGQLIAGADSSVYFADIPGVYRCRFSRFSASPSASDWNKWSKPVTIKESIVSKPPITAINTVHLPDINGVDSVSLVTTLDANLYYTWFKNGLVVGDTNYYNVKTAGLFTVATETLGGCPSANAEAINVTFNASINLATPSLLTAILTSADKIRLNWEDNSAEETAYEVYRSTSENGFYKFLARLPEDAISYLDATVTSNDDYYYKIRAVSYTEVSPYTAATFVASGNDNEVPTTPLNLTVNNFTLTSAALSWDASTDNEDVKEYIIYFGSDSIATGVNSTSFEVTGLKDGRTFGFTVKAIDYAGNLSLGSNQVNVTTIFEGLSYEHSTGAYTSLSQIDWSFVEYYGTAANFGLNDRTQDDYISFKFDGYINITEAGDYRFRSWSDDGSRVFIGGFDPLNLNTNLVNNNDGTHGCNVNQTYVTLSLAVGSYPITVIFFENGGGQCLSVEYSKDGSTFTTIPDSMLKSGTIIVNNPPVAPTNLVASSAGLSQIDLNWDHSELIPDNTNIVVLGSSTAEGYGITPFDSAWVGRLDTWLGDNSTNYTLTNLAVGGFSTYEIRPDGSDNGANAAVDVDYNITKALSLNPDYLIINLPSNNANLLIPADTTMAHYREIKALADKAGIKTFIISPQPRNMGGEKKVTLLKELDSVRAGFGNYVIDVFDSLAKNDGNIRDEYFLDYAHVNKDGHAYIFSKVKEKLLSHLTHYDVYRSTTSGGSFSLLGAVNNGVKTYADKQLMSGLTYYYKVKAVNKNGESSFSNEANATNAADTEAPSVPQNLVAINVTYTNASFTWDVSTDNDKITYYELTANGDIIGTSNDNTFYTTDLLPDSTYIVAVKAYDRTGNSSAFGAGVNVTSDAPIVYYSRSSGDLNLLASWGLNTNGTGNAPTSFALNGQVFKVSNRGTTSAVATDWTVGGLISKVVVTENEAVNIDGHLIGKVQLEKNGALTINGNNLPTFEESSANSHVILNNFTELPSGKFGNLTLNGPGVKNVSAEMHMVKGNLTVADGITLKGSSNNASSLHVKGNLNFLGTGSEVAQDNRIELVFSGNTQHEINTTSNIDLYQLSTTEAETVALISPNNVTVTIGSQKGGGVLLANNSLLKVSGHTLALTGAASYNANNATARLAINKGDINFDVTSDQDSHLYFDVDSNLVSHMALNLTGNGGVVLEEPMSLIVGLDLTAGDLNANGKLTLKSDAVQTAMIKTLPTGATITGTLAAERYVDPMKAYRYMGTPVSGVTVADWQNYFPITGNFTGASTGGTLGTSASMYRYSESEGGWLVHPAAATDDTAPITVGTGYSPYIRDGVNDLVITNVGTPTQGDFSFTLSGGTGGGATDGWNLLANPYPATIAWGETGWASNGIGDVLSVADNNPANTQFFYHDKGLGTGTLPNGEITSGQGFWVQAVIASPTLTITEQAKSTNANATQAIYYRTAATEAVNYLKLTLKELSSSNEDATIIKFTPEGNNFYDKGKDGFKRPNGIINFYSLTSDGEKVAINSMSNEFCQQEISLEMNNIASGAYEVIFNNADVFNIATAELYDTYEDVTIALSSTPSYSFTIDKGVVATYQNRFKLVLDRPTINRAIPLNYSSELCIGSEITVSIDNAQPGAVYSVKDEAGNIFLEEQVANFSSISMEIPEGTLAAGIHKFSIDVHYPGCEVQTLDENVSVNMKAIEAPTVVQEVVQSCEGIAYVLFASGAKEGEHYVWHESYSGITSNNITNTLLVESLEEDIASYEVSIVSALGCVSDNFATIEITEEDLIPEPIQLEKILVYDSILCEAEDFSLTVEATQAGMEYALANTNLEPLTEWITGDGADKQFVFAAETIGLTELQLLVRFPGCDYEIMQGEISYTKNVLPKPVLEKARTTYCNQVAIDLNVNSEATSFNWYYNGFEKALGAHSSQLRVSNLDSAGYYYVKTVNDLGCVGLAYDSIYISESDLMVENVDLDLSLSTIDEICIGQSISAQVLNPQPGINYFILNNEGAILSDTLSVATQQISLSFSLGTMDQAGSYQWQVMAFKTDCKVEKLNQQLDFTVLAYPVIVLTETSYSICSGEALTITTPNLENGASVKWFDAAGQELSDNSTLAITNTEAGNYSYYVKAYNALGCTDGTQTAVEVLITDIASPVIERQEDLLTVANLVEGDHVNWFLNDELITSGAAVDLVDEGVYFAEVERNGCTAISEYFEYIITVTANNQSLSQNNVLVYPNPTTTFSFTVAGSASTESDVDISMYDAFGRMIYKESFSKAEFEHGALIQLKGVEPRSGVYLVAIQQGDRLVRKKIIMK
ncbi:MAG: lysophospholipase L1-like esterase [Marivirga sp.]|jgi:lysophospholipase L1-like esterase